MNAWTWVDAKGTIGEDTYLIGESDGQEQAQPRCAKDGDVDAPS